MQFTRSLLAAGLASIEDVTSPFSRDLRSSFHRWWREQTEARGPLGLTSLLVRELWGYLRDSTPARRRSRYGDMDYDWEQRVNTTAGTLDWRTRLLGVFHSPYQPTDPAVFREMMAALAIDYRQFTFIDIGAGKGRTLLMAAEYPFKKIVGVEVMAELHRTAVENIAAWRAQSPARSVASIEAVCLDARAFVFPGTPLVVYLFNPLPEPGLRQVIRSIEESWRQVQRTIWVVYHNPLLESILTSSTTLIKVQGEPQFSLFKTK